MTPEQLAKTPQRCYTVWHSSAYFRLQTSHFRLQTSCLLLIAMCFPLTTAEAKLKVVTTTTDLKSIVEAVGGDQVEVASLGTGHEDPHFIDAKPSYMVLARNADLWVRIGMELEIGYE